MTRSLFAPLLALMLIASQPAGAAQTIDIATVRAMLAGTWQSADDTRFTREFDADGRSSDRYFGDDSATTAGHWTLFLGSAPPTDIVGRKFIPNVFYLRLEQNGDVLLFGLAALSSSDLKMVYLERGNVLSFVRLK